MQVPRAVDAEADQELVFGQESAPFIVEEGAIGLQGIVDALAAGIAALQFDHLAEEAYAEHESFDMSDAEQEEVAGEKDTNEAVASVGGDSMEDASDEAAEGLSDDASSDENAVDEDIGDDDETE